MDVSPPNSNQNNTNNNSNQPQAEQNQGPQPFASGLAQANQHQVPEIALPKGGGALKGIDEKFEVNPVTGSSGLSIPLPVAPARAGFSPALSISYSSGGGNGLFGMGWGLGLASISRRTNRELPQYKDGEESDTFILAGAEDLIPKLENSTGAWLPVTRTEGNYKIKEYRPRIEGSWVRIEQWTDQTTGLMHWRTISTNNVITVYGDTPTSRIANPQDALQIFEWKVSYTYDNLGNIILYEYQKENLIGVLPTVYEQNRAPVSNTYLKRVHYGNRNSYKHGDPLPSSADFLYETVLDYGDHSSTNVSPAPDQDWNARRDAFSSFRAGFDIRTYRLCQRVLLFHKFDASADQAIPNLLVSALELTYEAFPEAQQSSPHLEGFTYLKAVQTRGYLYDTASSSYTSKTQPPMELFYQGHTWDTTLRELDNYEQMPIGINQGKYQWVDFYGEGIAGVLTEQEQAWYYKENLGNGQFSPAKLLAEKPAFLGLGSGLQFQDLQGDGERQLVNYSQAPKGFFEWKDGETWSNFQYFEAVPNRNLNNDPHARFIDLDGDGKADLLLTGDDLFQWHASKGKTGFGPANRIYTALEEEEGPRVVFADLEQSVFLADMTGDGLTDIVRIRNGEVCYWANMGYGKFSAKITMQHAPTFDHEEQFNPKYLYLMDVDGSGTTDLAYYHKNTLQIWCNWSGNEFVQAPKVIAPFPHLDTNSRLDVVDLLGTGTSCLVWSSSHAKDQNIPLKYIHLSAGKKPHLLYHYRNNLGASTTLTYSHSTKFYLEAKQAGQPWATKLPFPVHVVEQVTQTDHIQQLVFTQQYSYAHGYYDRIEREFRGFGRVETLDTTSLDTLLATGANNVQIDHYQVPIKTVSWYHTGAALKHQSLTAAYEQEYYQNPTVEQALESTILPTSLDDVAYIEAFRALKGLPLRQEVYSLDTTDPAHIHPYSTSRQSYELKVVQPHEGQRYASFIMVPQQQISYAYERDPNDPRISQELVLASDDLGIPTQTASVIYRRLNLPTGLPWLVAAEQEKTHLVIRELQLTDDIDLPNSYRLRAAYEEQVYELLQVNWTVGMPYFEPQGLKLLVDAAPTLDYIEEPTVANQVYKRLHGHTKVQLLKDDLSGALPIDQLSSLAIPYKTYQLAYTSTQLTELFTTAATTNLLQGLPSMVDLGYIDLDGDGNWWLHSGTSLYDNNATQNFYLPYGVEDILGNQSVVNYDAYYLFPTTVEDALGNRNQVFYDYRVLQANKMIDLNGNQAEVAFDELGIVVKSAIMGKQDPQTGQWEGDTLDHPTAEMAYDFYQYYNHYLSNPNDPPKPNYIHSKVREEHYSQNPVATWQESYEYSNGMGGVVMSKVQTKDGEALQWQNGVLTTVDTTTLPTKRWIGNGRTILNNKGMPIKQFEPYFSVTAAYESAPELVEIGHSPTLYYDAAGRNNYTELPDGTFTKVEFDAWQATSYDVNDTILQSDWYTDKLAGNAAEQRAAQLAAQHANTPVVTHLDCLGRTVYAEEIAPSGQQNTAMYTQTDLAGRFSRVYDQLATAQLLQNSPNNYTTSRGVSSFTKTNLLGQGVLTRTAVKGDSYMLTDALGRMVRIWDNPDLPERLVYRTDYDNLHRPTATYVQQGTQAELCFAQTTYGESIGNAANSNLLGQAYETKDQSGVLSSPSFDFKGNPLRITRQLTEVYDQTIDWDQPVVPLEPTIFETSTTYDALNRPVVTTLPDNSKIRPTYNEGAYLERLEVQVMGQGAWQVFLDGQDFDAKGQQQWVQYGNGSWSRFFYDAKTFRLEQLVTYSDTNTTPSHIFQDLNYYYDPTGNIMEIEDKAQSTLYHNNQAISPKKTYEYDHLYRLIQATGREHVSNGAPRNEDFVHLQGLPHQHINTAIRTYTQSYQYDAVGNILQMQHQTGSAVGNWTRQYSYTSDATNQLLSTQLGSNTYNYNHYDRHGNMTKMPHLQALTWNFADELSSVQLNLTGDMAYYNYDGGGSRIRKVVQKANKREERLYLGGVERYRVYNNSGAVQEERWTLMVEGIAQVDTKTIDSGSVVANPVPLVRYQYKDHLGSATLETDATGNLISYEEYHPYGTTAYSTYINSSYSTKRYRFTNKERDDETGLYYFGVRYYAAWLGRWTSSDPGGFVDGLNLYRYVRNNPVNGVDAEGYSTENPEGSQQQNNKESDENDSNKSTSNEQNNPREGTYRVRKVWIEATDYIKSRTRGHYKGRYVSIEEYYHEGGIKDAGWYKVDDFTKMWYDHAIDRERDIQMKPDERGEDEVATKAWSDNPNIYAYNVLYAAAVAAVEEEELRRRFPNDAIYPVSSPIDFFIDGGYSLVKGSFKVLFRSVATSRTMIGISLKSLSTTIINPVRNFKNCVYCSISYATLQIKGIKGAAAMRSVGMTATETKSAIKHAFSKAKVKTSYGGKPDVTGLTNNNNVGIVVGTYRDKFIRANGLDPNSGHAFNVIKNTGKEGGYKYICTQTGVRYTPAYLEKAFGKMEVWYNLTN